MTSNNSRRDFLKVAGGLGAISTLGLTGCANLALGSGANVVVIGGGFGGATAARYIKRFDPSLSVMLIEPNRTYVTCPFSNAYLGGIVDMKTITHDYSGVAREGIQVVHQTVTAVDAQARTVTLDGGSTLNYDRLVVSPGIDFKWNTPGYDMAASALVPHAYKAGPQTVMLKKQLEDMEDGGVVVICPPENPFRCPPGPYERASMIAHYLKYNKPRSKVLILDPKNKFSKQPLFQEGWDIHYKNYIEWVPGDKGGKIDQVDAKNRTVHAEFDTHKAGVLNVIPNQKAGKIAHVAGLTDASGWCPVDFFTFESKIHKNIHVIGDAAIVKGMPKSGNAANAEARACAFAVVSMLKDQPVGAPKTNNTCYSFITPKHGISVSVVWNATPEGFQKQSGGVSPKGQSADFRALEAEYAHGWYANISKDTWG